MRRSFIAASISLLFATIVWAANPSPMNLPRSADAGRHAVTLQSTEPEAATLQVGGPVPMFSFIGPEGRWHRSDELLSRGPVLLMFGPGEGDLVAIQKLTAAFNELGVRPVPVLDIATRGASALGRKLGLTTTLVSDPMSAIAGLYHSIDSATGRHAPSYFLIDSKRTLRAMYYGPLPPAELLVATAARGLGRPLPPSLFSTSDER